MLQEHFLKTKQLYDSSSYSSVDGKSVPPASLGKRGKNTGTANDLCELIRIKNCKSKGVLLSAL